MSRTHAGSSSVFQAGSVHAERLARRLIELAEEIGEAVQAIVSVHDGLSALLEIRAERDWTSQEFGYYLHLTHERFVAHRRYETVRLRYETVREHLPNATTAEPMAAGLSAIRAFSPPSAP